MPLMVFVTSQAKLDDGAGRDQAEEEGMIAEHYRRRVVQESLGGYYRNSAFLMWAIGRTLYIEPQGLSSLSMTYVIL